MTDPPQDHVDLHSQQEPVEQHQQPGDAVAELPGPDAVLGVLGELDGLHDEGQHPVDQQSCRQLTDETAPLIVIIIINQRSTMLRWWQQLTLNKIILMVCEGSASGLGLSN